MSACWVARLSCLVVSVGANWRQPPFSAFWKSRSVLEVDDDNFGDVVTERGDKGVLLYFYAPWCGKCRDNAEDYGAVADAFDRYKDRVAIAAVDGDASRDLADSHSLVKYPAFFWFPPGAGKMGKYDHEAEGYDKKSIAAFVNEQMGLKAAMLTKRNYVRELTDRTFDTTLEATKDSLFLVMFVAPWCGHCKKVDPVLAGVAEAYAEEKRVTIARIDGDEYRDLSDKYQATGFPHIIAFQPGTTEFSRYDKGRDLMAMLEYVAEHTGIVRLEGGRTDPKNGRTDELDALADEFMNSDADMQKLVVKKANEMKTDMPEAAYYCHVMERILEIGKKHLAKEIPRMDRIITRDPVTPKKVTELSTKLNVLYVFLDAHEIKGKELSVVDDGMIFDER